MIPCLCQQDKNKKLSFDRKQVIGTKDYEKWLKTDVEAFTLYRPKSLKVRRKDCGYKCHYFQDQKSTLIVNPGSLWISNSIKVNLKYSEKFMQIDGKSVWIRFIEDKDGLGYRSFVDFWDEKGKRWGTFIRFYSKKLDAQQTAEKIFSSIKFNQNRTLIFVSPIIL